METTALSDTTNTGSNWLVLNLLGLLSFGLFLACLATAEYKYTCAVMALAVLLWAWIVARPRLTVWLQRSVSGVQDTASMPPSIVAHFPLWLGSACLLVLAVFPLLLGDLQRYWAVGQVLKYALR